jgi:arylsulfatase
LLLFTVGCGSEPDGGVAGLQARLTRAAGDRLQAYGVEVVRDERGRWLAYPLRREDFRPAGLEGVWRAERAAIGQGSPDDGSAGTRLALGSEVVDAIGLAGGAQHLTSLPIGAFAVGGDALYLRADTPSDLPEVCEVREFVAGADRPGPSRVRIGGFSGTGAVLIGGDVCAASLKASGAEVELWLTTVGGAAGTATPEPLRFTVRLGDELVAVFEQAVGPAPTAVARRVPLPDVGRGELRVTVGGPPVIAGIFEPRIVPSNPPSEPGSRPDLVVFLADTYRADNLACYGGDPRIAPNLNALAQESLRFLRTWAPSSWTLPSHAALFSGMYPYQSTVVRGASALPEEVETLAERFADAGYRCGAVTDAGCVSAAYALDQGFAWFDEEWSSPERTLAAVERFLDGDDGRPQLLFVQSYRAHNPYVVGPDAARSIGGSESDVERVGALFAQVAADVRATEGRPRDELEPELTARARELETLYRGASAELDVLFGDLRALLARRGLADAFLVVTSDHGEAFLEHGLLEHGNGTYEELTRVPLLIHGPGVTPGDRLEAASLVDLPRTLAHLADVAPSPAWLGRSLLEAPAAPPVAFAFECDLHGGPSSVAVVDGPLKMIALLEAEGGLMPFQVFDLAVDPAERSPLATDRRWRDLWLAREPELELLLQSRVPSSEARLSDAERGVLSALGYAGR